MTTLTTSNQDLEKEERMQRARETLVRSTNDYFIVSGRDKQGRLLDIQNNPVEVKKINTWMVDGNGTWLTVKNKIGSFTAKIADKAPTGLAKVLRPCFRLDLPKIPEKVYYQIQTLFRDIAAEMGSAEAFAQIYYDNEQKDYVVYVPPQHVSVGSVKYDSQKNLSVTSPEKYTFVMEIHSHNNMGAFFSGTDNADEKETRFYGVFGKIAERTPEFVMRFVMHDEKLQVDPHDVFNFVGVNTEYPQEWKENIKRFGEKTGVKHLDEPEGSKESNHYRSYGNWHENEDLPSHVRNFINEYEKHDSSDPDTTKKEEARRFGTLPWPKLNSDDGPDFSPEEDLQDLVEELQEAGNQPEERFSILEDLASSLQDSDIPILVAHLEEYGFGHNLIETMKERRIA